MANTESRAETGLPHHFKNIEQDESKKVNKNVAYLSPISPTYVVVEKCM